MRYAKTAFAPSDPPGDPAAVGKGRSKGRDKRAREAEVRGEGIATLSVSVLRLWSGLDLARVLLEAADCARTLTNARWSS